MFEFINHYFGVNMLNTYVTKSITDVVDPFKYKLRASMIYSVYLRFNPNAIDISLPMIISYLTLSA